MVALLALLLWIFYSYRPLILQIRTKTVFRVRVSILFVFLVVCEDNNNINAKNSSTIKTAIRIKNGADLEEIWKRSGNRYINCVTA
ncbi:MAG TPA: hypothetical protein VFT71_03835 [Candidatus Nitrosocosmicus sp.]|nr:hypothetical protein [Candidatus Nitrosocosmicus sp.]